MISRESADAIARALLEDAQRQSNDRKNAALRHGSLFFGFPELRRFEPWQRNVITRRCAALVIREPLTVVLFAAWLLFAWAIAFMLPPRIFGVSLGQISVLVGLLLILFHTFRVRQYVRAFLAFVEERLGTGASAG